MCVVSFYICVHLLTSLILSSRPSAWAHPGRCGVPVVDDVSPGPLQLGRGDGTGACGTCECEPLLMEMEAKQACYGRDGKDGAPWDRGWLGRWFGG